ncbi:DUF2905 domain-containing protein [Thermomicrobium sp.]|jgi:hypothetical protein|uniref:DUF2905 domain-containing protein n=1 Tax=Thermomicrobium sp. TaxID=1969469 RepID=UPI001B289B25|nr:DUF2905 domain-containing protein [Thermomicrobium sp.]MBO9307288.1 DUF2905 domain-containing protein [Thermomicrobium sp.]MBO9351210.1 DUF2905 domain-containing protein [Thermomicrobium sp.]MBO9359429.1 DUF2905 domain-containing protein [Thermomicrobium sp.]MBO9385719.1 DUF2905 domain-containing protein [Thermomicrobium sp.]
MESLQAFGRLLIVMGLLLAILGVLLVLAGRIPFIGRLPGDIVYQRGNFTLYIPLMTMLILSLLLTILLNLLFRR